MVPEAPLNTETIPMGNHTSKLIDLFQKAFQAGTVERDPDKYLAKYHTKIAATGKVFQYLDLAKPDRTSVLGWKPTKRLLNLIAKPNAHPRKTKQKAVEAQVVFDLMLDTMPGSERTQGLALLCIHALIKLGLVIEDSLGDCMPTVELLDLFTDSYYFRAWGVHDPNATYELVLEGTQQ
jgi:hypothetical protein